MTTKWQSSAQVRFLVDGVEVSAGFGRESPLDSPLSAVAFAINDTCRRGLRVEAGALIIAGHACQARHSSRLLFAVLL